jgi:hypothetical protein
VCGVQCAVCGAVCGTSINAVCGSVQQERTAVSGSVAVCAAVCGNVWLFYSAAVCGSGVVCRFSNKFKTYSYKFV